ncbi:MAG TPA: aminotransferase class III-fold pyridoxal phosphate-dependent enzyme [Thermomicrobiaceae bacterium]|nr:aminotransferase class III-fold pyridoxal phosphate-dependent enzyme [Thermomicrobiaceae bacterium]
MEPRSDHQDDLLARAETVLGGAAGSFKLPTRQAIVVGRAEGSHLWDTDGREFIDYLLGSGPLLIGHAHPEVVAAVQRQAALGSTYYTLNVPLIELAERMVAAIPCAEQVKFVSSGSEATFHALRIARAYTGRSRVLKFEGGFHGVNDYALMSALASRQTAYPTPIPDSAGIPHEVEADVLVSRWNDVALTRRIVAEHAGELAAIICEPLQRSLVPAPGFLAELRTLADRHGILLVFDEVVTGFRLAYGGAQERYGVVPDLATYGKAMSGGYPMAAIAGPREILGVTDPARRGQAPVAHLGGTLNGNPVAAAAGLATLEVLARSGSYDRLYGTTERLKSGLQELAQERGIAIKVPGDGPLFQVFFTADEVTDYPGVLATDRARSRRFGLACLERGLFLNPGEKFYVSLAHTTEDVERTLDVFADALDALD